jgi:hypothetical protein
MFGITRRNSSVHKVSPNSFIQLGRNMRSRTMATTLRDQDLATDETGAGIASRSQRSDRIVLGIDEQDRMLRIDANKLSAELLFGIDLPSRALVEERDEIVATVLADLLVHLQPLLELGGRRIRNQVPIATSDTA